MDEFRETVSKELGALFGIPNLDIEIIDYGDLTKTLDSDTPGGYTRLCSSTEVRCPGLGLLTCYMWLLKRLYQNRMVELVVSNALPA